MSINLCSNVSEWLLIIVDGDKLISNLFFEFVPKSDQKVTSSLIGRFRIVSTKFQ